MTARGGHRDLSRLGISEDPHVTRNQRGGSEAEVDHDEQERKLWEERLVTEAVRSTSGEVHGVISGGPYAELSYERPEHVLLNVNDEEVRDILHVADDSRHTAGSVGDKVLLPVPAHQQLALSFHNIDGFVPSMAQKPGTLSRLARKIRPSSTPAKPLQRQVLHHLSGVVHPGEVLALMGPSGSGKTSLLSVIGGRTPKMMKVSGQVLVNGQAFTKATRRRIGYVLQDDVLYEDLTVYETLLYAALLRLPREMTRSEKKQRVEAVIEVLGLTKSRNTIIGGFFRRGISGGERKRVSIGHELLINPAIMMLDEPTSGLDSTTALHLLQLLEQLAQGGRAILTTIHQPSSRLYRKLDKLLLLSEGHVMYYGAANLVLDWFGHLGYQLPHGINTADFILDMAMGETERDAHVAGPTGREAVVRMYQLSESYLSQRPQGFLDKEDLAYLGGMATKNVQQRRIPPASGAPAGADDDIKDSEDQQQRQVGITPFSTVSENTPPEASGEEPHREGAPYWQQVEVLWRRAVRVRRFEQTKVQNWVRLLAVSFITGLLWWQRGGKNTIAAANDVIGLLFFEHLFTAFSALFTALFTFPNEFRQLSKERPSGMYRVSAYYLARLLADLPMDLLQPTIFVIIIYWFGGLRSTAGAFFANLTSVLLLVLVAQSFGLLIGGAFMDPKTAQNLTTVVMLTFMLVGGFYVRNIPSWISWIRYLSFIFWGFNLLTKIEFRHTQYYDCGGLGANQPCQPVNNLKNALQLPINPNNNVWPEVVVLLGMLFVLRIATYYVLRAKTTPARGLVGR